MAVISLHRICSAVCDESDDSAKKTLAKLMRYANLATKDLVLNVVPWVSEFSVISRILPIGSNWMVDLPADYVYYVAVGLYVKGRIVLLGTADSLVAGPDTNNQNCTCTEEQTQEINNLCGCAWDGAGYSFWNTWNGGQFVGEMYGLHGGKCYLGYFKEDKANNRLLLSSDLPGRHIIVMYKADPTLNGINLVPSECELAIREFVHWRDNLNARPNIAQMHRSEYITEYEKLKKMYGSMNEDEWRNIFLKATTSTVQR